ncbi:hypothetical protein EDB89DRAFT_1912568 [Lactarius sanguifluus]|nr:hypothetical protein EDB89DRAFT_1912568 [Lactarius sanguifluus]
MHCKSGQLREERHSCEERHSSMSFKCRLSVTTASSRTDALVRLRAKHLSAMRRDHSSAEKDANARLQQRCHVRADICGELEDRRTRVNVRKTRKTTSSRAKSRRKATSLASPGVPVTVAAPRGQWQLVQASDRPQRCAMVATHRKDHGKNPRHVTRMLRDGHTTRVHPRFAATKATTVMTMAAGATSGSGNGDSEAAVGLAAVGRVWFSV